MLSLCCFGACVAMEQVPSAPLPCLACLAWREGHFLSSQSCWPHCQRATTCSGSRCCTDGHAAPRMTLQCCRAWNITSQADRSLGLSRLPAAAAARCAAMPRVSTAGCMRSRWGDTADALCIVGRATESFSLFGSLDSVRRLGVQLQHWWLAVLTASSMAGTKQQASVQLRGRQLLPCWLYGAGRVPRPPCGCRAVQRCLMCTTPMRPRLHL